MLNKKIISLVALAGLFCFAGIALAVEIPNPLGGGVNSFGDLLLKIADGAGTIVASLGVVMIIVAGILYLISAGNPQRMQTAKSALTYAIIGIAVGIAAKSIVEVVQDILKT